MSCNQPPTNGLDQLIKILIYNPIKLQIREEVYIFHRDTLMPPMQSSNFSFGGYRDTVEKLFYSARRSDGKLASTEKGSKPISKLTSAGTQYLFDAADGVVIVLMRRRSCCWKRLASRSPSHTKRKRHQRRHFLFTISSKFLRFNRAKGFVSGIVLK